MSQNHLITSLFLLLGLTCWIVTGRPDVGIHTQVLGEWHTTSWESCEPEKVFQAVNDSANLVITPTVGLQRRTLTCISANASVLPPSWCGNTSKPQPQQQRRCIVAQPCRLADWSPWETLQQGCRGDDDQVVSEIRRRQRRIVGAPLVPTTIRTVDSSRLQSEDECPPWEEKLFIDRPSQLPLCNQRYKWQPSPWSTCRANSPISSAIRMDTGPNVALTSVNPPVTSPSSQICGGGIQMRGLTCLRLSDSRPVNSRLCRALTLLPTVQHCEIPCDSDCQVGEWSPWSPCMAATCVKDIDSPGLLLSPLVTSSVKQASTDRVDKEEEETNDSTHSLHYRLGAEKTDDKVASGYQFRHRRILSNASADGTECPALSQLRRCHTDWGDACYRWEVQPLLDTCHLADNATCGLGYHELVFRCRRYDGVTVDDDECSNNTLAPLEQVACTVQCSSDCILSPWSEWTPCIHQGRRRRTRYVVGLPQPDSQPCPNQLMEEQICSVEQQMEQLRWPIFGWWPLPWGPCQMIDGTASSCGAGTHTREVRCTRDDGQHVDDFHCALLSRPESVRVCNIPCPEECRLSDWSSWSQCSDQSKDDAIQTRIRVVLQQPVSAASPSLSSSFTWPPLVEKRSCFDWLVQQERIDWQVSSWSPCYLATNAKCGNGISIRSVHCHDGNNVTIDPSVCLAKLMDEYRQLETHRECSVPCRRDGDSKACRHQHSIETRSLCPRNCIGTRSISGSNRDECDDGDDDAETKLAEDCPCERVTLELEDWSTCIIEEDHARSCGRGKQFRRRKCIVTATGQLAPLHWCNEEDFETRSCEVPCPVDCQLSSWSSWTNCNSTCGPGIQQRHRKIEIEPANGGRPCGSMEEIQACNLHSCDAYRWRTSDWTPCHLASGERCGSGLQTRYVRCVNVLEDMVVGDIICDRANKPSAEQPCQIACPGHCVISSWSSWSPCQHCRGERRRERSIIRNPVYNHTCPPLEEIESCSSPASGGCFGYDWQVSEWSSCQPLGGSNCGEGVRTRIASCVRNDGYITESNNCDSHTRPGLTEMWCHVECPIDCQVSPWSAWDDSECAPCGHHSGLRSRHREIQMINNQFGRSCPTSLRQQLPCPYQPCYEWLPSNWSDCFLQGAQCGTGVRRQLFECILEETGKRVDPEFCRLSHRPSPAHMTECKVLCTFEKLVKVSIEETTTKDSVSSIFPSSIDDNISVLYYPNDGEFNIWMVAMIAIGSLFLVFVGVTIFLICSSREESSGCKRNASMAGAPSEFRTRVHRVSNASH
uniref:Spondin-like TSP1 domain-containing protein n=1 Tax=Daphnia galeata TaxID=27404 RepID=A0A8J2RK10_9CRUS|nr:unnamed protein product [Daphnia galeata]